MKQLTLFFLTVLFFLPAKAIETDSLQVSLMTVIPHAREVYTVYGHTVLRVCDPGQNIDAIFSWGTFDSHAHGYVYHFMKGETDYFLSVMDYESFQYVYMRENATVIEQKLNFTSEAKAKLMQILFVNMEPENRVYRYNFLFDNCTTRVRDIIEQCTGNQLDCPESNEPVTFRKLIHSCTDPYPWMTFGIDLLIGSGADSLISPRQELFLPLKLKDALDGVTVNDERLVLSSEQILTSIPEPVTKLKFWDYPNKVGTMFLLIITLVLVFGWVKKRLFSGFFATIFFVAGAAGCIIAFFTLFSAHPCTSPNWNVLWLHPFHLFAAAGYFLTRQGKPFRVKLFAWYHAINLVLLSAVLLEGYWSSQVMNRANLPFVFCLGLASGYWLFYYSKKFPTFVPKIIE